MLVRIFVRIMKLELGLGCILGKVIKNNNHVAGPSVKKAKRPITLHTDDSSFDLGFNAHIEDGDEQMPAKGTLGTNILKLVQM